MSLNIQTDLFCDVCADWFTVFSSSQKGLSLKRAREKAAKVGWTTTKEEGRRIDVCPKHTENTKKA